MVVEQLNFS